MKIAITGGTGYLGSVLGPLLAGSAPGVTRVDLLDVRPPAPALVPQLGRTKLGYASADLTSPSAGALISQYDLIIHLAALVGYPACNAAPDLAQRINVDITRTIAEKKKPGARCLLASTLSNYGEQPGDRRIDETASIRATSVYSRTKSEAERLVLADRTSIVFRFAIGFGLSPAMRDDILIHDFIRHAAEGLPLSVYENGFVRQFIHVTDMAHAVLFALEHWNRMGGELYNVGHPDLELTKRELVEQIAAHCPFSYRFEDSGSDPEKRNYKVSFQKLMRAGFVPKVTLRSGIEELVGYYRQRPKRSALGR